MKKMYTCFEIIDSKLCDLGWNRYDTEMECYLNDIQDSMCKFEIIILPIYIPLK
jgi:hypothetical protein